MLHQVTLWFPPIPDQEKEDTQIPSCINVHISKDYTFQQLRDALTNGGTIGATHIPDKLKGAYVLFPAGLIRPSNNAKIADEFAYLKCSPDIILRKPFATDSSRTVNQAVEIMLDPDKEIEYDSDLNSNFAEEGLCRNEDAIKSSFLETRELAISDVRSASNNANLDSYQRAFQLLAKTTFDQPANIAAVLDSVVSHRQMVPSSPDFSSIVSGVVDGDFGSRLKSE